MISQREMMDIIATEALEAGSPAPTGSAGSPWPARDIVAKLVEASDLLLDHCNYDGDGWEGIHTARAHARDWLAANGLLVLPLDAPESPNSKVSD